MGTRILESFCKEFTLFGVGIYSPSSPGRRVFAETLFVLPIARATQGTLTQAEVTTINEEPYKPPRPFTKLYIDLPGPSIVV